MFAATWRARAQFLLIEHESRRSPPIPTPRNNRRAQGRLSTVNSCRLRGEIPSRFCDISRLCSQESFPPRRAAHPLLPGARELSVGGRPLQASQPIPVISCGMRGEIPFRFCDFSRLCSQENFPPPRAAHSLIPGARESRRWALGRSQASQPIPANQTRPAGADFSSASSDFKALGAFFCNFVFLAARQPESRTVSRAPVYQILWVQGFRAHTISRPGFNLFKSLRRHFRAGRRRLVRTSSLAGRVTRGLLDDVLPLRDLGDRNAAVQGLDDPPVSPRPRRPRRPLRCDRSVWADGELSGFDFIRHSAFLLHNVVRTKIEPFRNLRKKISYFRRRRPACAGGQGSALLRRGV